MILFPKLTVDKEVQLSNAESPIVVVELRNTTDDKVVDDLKQLFPIEMTVDGIIIC